MKYLKIESKLERTGPLAKEYGPHNKQGKN